MLPVHSVTPINVMKKVKESNQTLKYREKTPEASSQLATSEVNQATIFS